MRGVANEVSVLLPVVYVNGSQSSQEVLVHNMTDEQ